METLRGKVSNIRHTTHVSGGQYHVSTYQVAIFDLNGTSVRYSGAAELIADGDELIIAGKLNRGTFDVLAFRNLTRNTEASRESPLLRIIGIGLVLNCFLQVSLFTDLGVVFYSIIGAIIGGVMLSFEMRNQRAKELVQKGMAKPNEGW